MKELLYPFDPNYILENKRKIKKQLLADSNAFIDKKIAILGGYTTALIKQMMELFLSRRLRGIWVMDARRTAGVSGYAS